MGYDAVSITIYGRVSRHNSEKDVAHDARWAELRAEVKRLVERYESDDEMTNLGVWVD